MKRYVLLIPFIMMTAPAIANAAPKAACIPVVYLMGPAESDFSDHNNLDFVGEAQAKSQEKFIDKLQATVIPNACPVKLLLTISPTEAPKYDETLADGNTIRIQKNTTIVEKCATVSGALPGSCTSGWVSQAQRVNGKSLGDMFNLPIQYKSCNGVPYQDTDVVSAIKDVKTMIFGGSWSSCQPIQGGSAVVVWSHSQIPSLLNQFNLTLDDVIGNDGGLWGNKNQWPDENDEAVFIITKSSDGSFHGQL